MTKVLVTGKDSQLAKCIRDITKKNSKIIFVFKDSKNLDITDSKSVKINFESTEYDYCINCAAYTAVDRAEVEPEIAKKVNTTGVVNLIKHCKAYNVKLIHISTDFVFDGQSNKPYLESDFKTPLGVYGKTKSEAENKIIETLTSFFIIRTSWLYSQYNKNFLKSMLHLATKKKQIRVVGDQVGSPTNANDLAEFLCEIINSKSSAYGIYHFCNKGEASWYDFAKEIFNKWGINTDLLSISTSEYPTAAIRPKYSVMDTSKAERIFKIKINHWVDALINLRLCYNKE